jgi:DNA repair exonuclease SbcCD ATPase subunit
MMVRLEHEQSLLVASRARLQKDNKELEERASEHRELQTQLSQQARESEKLKQDIEAARSTCLDRQADEKEKAQVQINNLQKELTQKEVLISQTEEALAQERGRLAEAVSAANKPAPKCEPQSIQGPIEHEPYWGELRTAWASAFSNREAAIAEQRKKREAQLPAPRAEELRSARPSSDKRTFVSRAVDKLIDEYKTKIKVRRARCATRLTPKPGSRNCMDVRELLAEYPRHHCHPLNYNGVGEIRGVGFIAL